MNRIWPGVEKGGDCEQGETAWSEYRSVHVNIHVKFEEKQLNEPDWNTEKVQLQIQFLAIGQAKVPFW